MFAVADVTTLLERYSDGERSIVEAYDRTSKTKNLLGGIKGRSNSYSSWKDSNWVTAERGEDVVKGLTPEAVILVLVKYGVNSRIVDAVDDAVDRVDGGGGVAAPTGGDESNDDDDASMGRGGEEDGGGGTTHDDGDGDGMTRHRGDERDDTMVSSPTRRGGEDDVEMSSPPRVRGDVDGSRVFLHIRVRSQVRCLKRWKGDVARHRSNATCLDPALAALRASEHAARFSKAQFGAIVAPVAKSALATERLFVFLREKQHVVNTSGGGGLRFRVVLA